MADAPHCGTCTCKHSAQRPPGCVCNAGEWGDPTHLPPICDEHKGDRDENCDECEHDFECHPQLAEEVEAANV